MEYVAEKNVETVDQSRRETNERKRQEFAELLSGINRTGSLNSNSRYIALNVPDPVSEQPVEAKPEPVNEQPKPRAAKPLSTVCPHCSSKLSAFEAKMNHCMSCGKSWKDDDNGGPRAISVGI